jgi:hypothetical protein
MVALLDRVDSLAVYVATPFRGTASFWRWHPELVRDRRCRAVDSCWARMSSPFAWPGDLPVPFRPSVIRLLLLWYLGLALPLSWSVPYSHITAIQIQINELH